MVDESPAAVQKIMGVPTSAVLFCQRLGTEATVGLGLIQRHNALLTAHKSRTVPPQLVLDFSLRQNKSGGRFFALRSVNLFDLLGFGGEDSIQKT